MHLRKLAVSCVVLSVGLVAPAAASAATFTVNTTTDRAEVGGCETDPGCSLREALRAAQISPDPVNVVNVPAGHYGLSIGELDYSGQAVTIRGGGARVTTIDAQGTSRILDVSGGKVTIEGVTLTGGAADEPVGAEFAGDGGAILARGSEPLTVVRSTISGNRAAQNGGGISAPPESGVATTVNVIDSTVSGNKVVGGIAEGLGGGIYALGQLELVNSTVAGNSVENTALPTSQGGGVLVGTDPANTGGTTVSILNSTIAGNSVPTGGIGGGLAVYNPVGAGITGLTVKNTIVAGNTAAGAPSECGTVAVVSSTNNISGDGSCMFTDAGSKQNTNPLLGAPASNGGETDTMALSAGSPAIDAGTNAGCPATDQRGVARPQGPTCDIGAFELQPTPPAPPTTTTSTASADLGLTLKAKPKRPKAGHKFRFVLRVADRGPASATAIVVSGTVPAAARSVKGQKVNGKRACKLAKARKGKRKLTCRLGTLGSGKARTVMIVVGAGTRARKLHASARVSSAVADPRPKNSRAKAVAMVVPR